MRDRLVTTVRRLAMTHPMFRKALRNEFRAKRDLATMKRSTIKRKPPVGPFTVRLEIDTFRGKNFPVKDLRAASRAVRAYLEEHDASSSEWCGGEVRDARTRQVVAVVSFNGRVWTPGPKNPEGRHVAGDTEFDLDAPSEG